MGETKINISEQCNDHIATRARKEVSLPKKKTRLIEDIIAFDDDDDEEATGELDRTAFGVLHRASTCFL
jgi:hypothetical protein